MPFFYRDNDFLLWGLLRKRLTDPVPRVSRPGMFHLDPQRVLDLLEQMTAKSLLFSQAIYFRCPPF